MRLQLVLHKKFGTDNWGWKFKIEEGKSKTLAIALSSEIFLADTELAEIERYKNTLKRFEKLRKAVQYRYAEVIDYKDYEPKIQKLLDTHIHADTVTRLNEPTYIINENTGL